MKPLSEWKQADLEALIGLTEGQTVEFKQSEALLFTGKEADERRRELVKDVTALANAAGGRIYFGVREAKGAAAAIDDGISVADLKPERINDILTSNIEPAIHGVAVFPVPLDNGQRAFVIDVPQATTLAPHQSRLHKQYFRRYDTKAQAMLDHEIKDLMRRSEAPLIVANMLLMNRDEHGSCDIAINIENVSPALVKYFSVTVTVGQELQFTQPALSWTPLGTQIVEDPEQRWAGYGFNYQFTPTSHLPLFKGQKHTICCLHSVGGSVAFRRVHMQIAAPGFVGQWRGMVQVFDTFQQVHLEPFVDAE